MIIAETAHPPASGAAFGQVIRFGAIAAAVVALAAWLLGFAFSGSASHEALWISAAVAVAVQLVTFALARAARVENRMGAWGLGVLLRFLVLIAYAFIAVRALALPAAPALIGLVVFFFLSTLIEPLLLRT